MAGRHQKPIGLYADALSGSRGNRPDPAKATTGQNIGYVDKLRHKYWHFVDKPFSPDGTETVPPDMPDAQTQIAAFRTALAPQSGKSEDVRSYDLTWLIHLVGDVHQPLHATQRFTKADPHGDAGGNAVKIDCGTGYASIKNLHSFWDDVLGTNDNNLSAIAAAAKALPQPDGTRASISDEKVWIQESFELAEKRVYKSPPIGRGAGESTLTERYKNDARKTAEEQVAVAGARLANLIDDALK